MALVLRLGASSLRLGGRSRGLRLMLLFRLHTWRLRRRLHGLLHRGLPLGLGLAMLCLRLRLWLRLQLRFGCAQLRALLFLLRAGCGRRRLLELLPAHSLTGLVAIVAGANRPLLLYGLGIART